MKPKKLPRLWCALQGLLPLKAREVAQRVGPAATKPITGARSRAKSPREKGPGQE